MKWLEVVDMAMKQAKSAHSNAEQWGSRRYLAGRQGPGALPFLMEVPDGYTSLRVSMERVRRLRGQATARAKTLGFKLNAQESPVIM